MAMETNLTELILSKTSYGVDIYAYILKACYPDDEVVISQKGRDCNFCRNPFNGGKRTLHVWIEKSDMNDVYSAEMACHRDSENAILPGDVFNFAALYFKKKGQELLETIKRELRIRDDKNFNFYGGGNFSRQTDIVEIPMFSFFKAPVINTKPHKSITILDAYHYITGRYARQRTEELRSLTSARERSTCKAARFDYCTFSGTFKSRSDKMLIKHSGLLCIDFDHVKDIETLFARLLKDEYFETQLLFRSPSGDGLKWVIPINVTDDNSHLKYFKSIEIYIKQTYGVEIDKSGKDISRACFLPYDPNAYINTKYL